MQTVMALVHWEFALVLRTLLALVFAVGAIGKFRHSVEFRGVIANYRLLPDALVLPVAGVLPAIEALLGAWLISGVATAWSAAAAAALLLIFAGAMAVNLRRGRRHIDCGCFQTTMRQNLSWPLVIRNLVLAIAVGASTASGGVAGEPLLGFGGVLVGVVLYVLLSALTLLWSIEPAWLAKARKLRGTSA